MPDFSRLCMGCMGDKGDSEFCPSCGFDDNDIQPLSYMPLRTLLDGRYLIGKSIDANCEVVTYIAWDTQSNVPVRVYEYFPEPFCDRAEDRQNVTVFQGKEYSFNHHLGQFLDIARALARCSDLPSLFPVTDIFEANGTAYYVTEHVKTITMREFLMRNGGMLSWDQVRPLLLPVMTTLAALHSEGVIHGGISPETLIVGVDGHIRIIGFCVPDVRTAHTEMNAQLFPGFTAIEQYNFDNKQGTWTDVYGFCATLYRILVGSPPADATERITNDKMIIPAKIAQEIPRNVLSALADGLSIIADDRIQTIDELKTELVPSASSNDKKAKSDASKKKRNTIIAVSAAVVLIAVAFLAYYFLLRPMFFDEKSAPSNAKAPSSSTASILDDPSSVAATYAVPNLVNTSYGQAVEDNSLYFKIEATEYEYNSKYSSGTIIKQFTKAGTKVTMGSTVKVKVSLGSATAVIPSTRGKTVDEATLALLKMGFNYNNIVVSKKYDANIDEGLVVSTSPEDGKSVSIFSKVYIYVSTYDGKNNKAVSSSTPSHSPNSKDDTSSGGSDKMTDTTKTPSSSGSSSGSSSPSAQENKLR